jgi:hypothetical protein
MLDEGRDTRTAITSLGGSIEVVAPARSVRRRRTRRVRHAVTITLVMAVAAFGLPAVAPSVASAQDQVPVGEVQIVDPLQQIETMQINAEGDIVSSEGGDYLLPGCLDSTVGTACIGDVTSEGDLNIIGGGAPIEVQGGALEKLALQWIIDEAEVYIHGAYGVPLDDRIQRYAAAEVRGYIVSRLLDIIDRAAYNVPLTPNEAQTLQLIQRHMMDADQSVATLAYDEYLRFKSNGCDYEPPSPPGFVADPVRLPADVVAHCARNPLRDELALQFMPPQPTESHFTAWGVYRHMTEIGLGEVTTPALQVNLSKTIAAIAFAEGVAAGFAAGLISGAIAGANTGLSTAVISAIAPFLFRAWGKVIGGITRTFPIPPGYVTATSASWIGGVVTIVVIALIIIVINSWLLHQYEKVGTNLSEAAKRAAGATDPFGLSALQAANQGKELREGMGEDNLPGYRQPEMIGKLSELVTRWMTVEPNGVVHPDATGVWPDPDLGTHDWIWELTDAEGNQERTEFLPFRLPDGSGATVRIRDGWMIVDTSDGPAAMLQFLYQTPDGSQATVSRRPGPDGGFYVTVARTDPATGDVTLDDAVETDSIPLADPRIDDGELVTVRLIPSDTPPRLDGPRPTVAGTFVPGWVHNLRPNPVDVNGNFDLDRFREDHEYQWELEHYDEASQAWVDVPLLDPPAGEPVYGAKFIPTVTGAYRAQVTMRPLDDPNAPGATGLVQFEIRPPVIELEEATLVDDGFSQLRLDLHLSQNTGGGNFEVEVRWPPQLGSDDPPPVTTLDIECLPLTAVACDTPRTVNVPVLRDALTHQLGPLSDLSQGVQLTVTNDHGGKVTRSFAVESPDRPRFAPPPAPPADEPALVAFNPNVTDVQIPVANPDASPTLVLATIVPGRDDQGTPGFSIYDPATGTVGIATVLNGNPRFIASVSQLPDGQWAVILDAAPNTEDIGAFSAPIGIQQNNGRRATMLLHVDVAPAPDDKYRVFLDSDVDPDDIVTDHLPVMVPVVVNGREDWDAYADELCLSLLNLNFPGDPIEKCAPIEEFRGADGELTFPWAELYPDGVEAGSHRARARLADTDRSWPVPHQVRFIMTSGAPIITDLAWDDSADQLTLGIQPFSTQAPVEVVTCTLDGMATPCFEPAGGVWAPPGLADGTHTLGVVVTDTAGNYDTASLEFTVSSVDATPPVITSEVVGTVGQGGFYVSDVTVTWTVTDDESAVEETTGCEPATVNTDAESHVLNCLATSEGGTSEESLTLSRDATPPTVAVTGVADGAVYTLGAVPEAACDTQDATSGVSTAATVTLEGANPDGTGQITATCAGATDQAGNAADPVAASYTVEAAAPTYDALEDLTTELVERPALRRALNLLVATAQRLDDRGFDRAADRTLDGYVALVRASTPRFIAPADADQLIALAESLQAA